MDQIQTRLRTQVNQPTVGIEGTAVKLKCNVLDILVSIFRFLN